MSPFTALYYKEYRQQSALALCMILFCFILQLGTAMMQLVTVVSVTPDYLAIGFLATALFAGAAAAIAFATEKDDRTFAFLRNLPVPAKTVMLGKVAWLLSSTAGVLAATSLLAGFWCIATNRYSGSAALASAFGVGILEALVWGFFWSPCCKTQVTALLATYFCASLFAYLAAAVCASSSHDVAAAYVSAIPIRLIIVALVAGFAVRGMSRWFEDSVQKQEKPAGWKFGNGNLARPSATVLPDGERGMMIAQKRVRSPFFSLLYQSFRQSSTLMLFGLGMVAALLGCGYYLYRCNAAQYVWSSDAFDLVVPGMVFGIFYLIFCGGIFAADQKNESYRFLSRCGIAPGKIWWSRIVSFLLPACPMILVFMAVVAIAAPHINRWELGPLDALKLYRPSIAAVFVTFAIPFCVGSFMSISMRSSIVAVTLTGVVSMCMYFWLLLGVNLFDFNPLWSTLPICMAFLLASRLRCGDWLRECRTWRGRWKVFAPILVAFAVICIIIPPIRIYSVPYISMEKLESEYVFNSVRKDRDGSTPEERKARFDEMRKKLSKPLSADGKDLFIRYLYTAGYSYDTNPTPETLKARCRKLEQSIKETPTYDAWLLKLYEIDYRRTAATWFYPPWEKTRYLRRLNEALVFALQYGDNDDWSWDVEEEWRYFFGRSWYDAEFNCFAWEWANASPYSFYSRSRYERLHLVEMALQAWHVQYLKHGEVLPATLDKLVELGYLAEIPVDPKTGERMEYFPKPDLETMQKHGASAYEADKKIETPMPFVKLGDATRVLQWARERTHKEPDSQ